MNETSSSRWALKPLFKLYLVGYKKVDNTSNFRDAPMVNIFVHSAEAVLQMLDKTEKAESDMKMVKLEHPYL